MVERGVPLPAWATDCPELALGEGFYLSAFTDLSSCREVGFGIGPIPWRDAIHYAQFKGLDDELTELFWVVISAMDSAYLAWASKEKPGGK